MQFDVLFISRSTKKDIQFISYQLIFIVFQERKTLF